LITTGSALSGCERARRVPRIDAELVGWPRPYRGVAGLEVHVFSTGSMSLPRGLLFYGGSWIERETIDVPAYVLRHPNGNLVVFDSGYASAVRDDPNEYLGFFVSLIGSFAMGRDRELPAQMEAAGMDPAAVTHVVLSHLHFDHAGSIERFPGAEVVVSRLEREAALAATGPLSPFRAEDFDEVIRWRALELEGEAPYATFAAHADLLGDGSLEIVPLPGHTLGSIGLIARLVDGPVLFAGDAAAVEESWRFAAFPARSEDRDAWWNSIWRIKKFLQLVPDAVVAGGHGLQLERVQGRSTIVVHPRQ
jgi:N-acyl homoserine lactone hydrolase